MGFACSQLILCAAPDHPRADCRPGAEQHNRGQRKNPQAIVERKQHNPRHSQEHADGEPGPPRDRGMHAHVRRHDLGIGQRLFGPLHAVEHDPHPEQIEAHEASCHDEEPELRHRRRAKSQCQRDDRVDRDQAVQPVMVLWRGNDIAATPVAVGKEHPPPVRHGLDRTGIELVEESHGTLAADRESAHSRRRMSGMEDVKLAEGCSFAAKQLI